MPSSSLPTFAPLVPLSPRPGFEPPTLPFRVEPLSLSRVDRGFRNGDGFAHGSRRAAFVGPFRQRDQLRGSGHRFVTPRSPVRFRAGAFSSCLDHPALDHPGTAR